MWNMAGHWSAGAGLRAPPHIPTAPARPPARAPCVGEALRERQREVERRVELEPGDQPVPRMAVVQRGHGDVERRGIREAATALRDALGDAQTAVHAARPRTHEARTAF